MIFYFLAPFIAFILVGFQITFFDLLFMGKISLELSLILTIFAGFRLSIFRGAYLSFLLGFCIDSMVSTVPCFFVILYMVVFLVSRIMSFRIFAENYIFIMIFTFLASFTGEIAAVVAFSYSCENAASLIYLGKFIIQGAILAAAGPFFFELFDKAGVFLNVKESQQT